jgi:cellulose synthase/poly-beta-1,6-N-acetylglucosamine synthase-like glycosyltransferase
VNQIQDILQWVLLASYFLPAVVLMAFATNLYLMLFFFARRRQDAGREQAAIMEEFKTQFDKETLPSVVTQVPIYNEMNVAERILRAAADMDYPSGKHTIQVLDDSTDETRDIVDQTAEDLRSQGVLIDVVRRSDRIGFKAGALDHGMQQTDADFLAIFDADFIPPRDFLLRTLPILLIREDVGMVQARWGHINANGSLLTKAQGIGIDGHFTIEQPARAWNNLFMNFNGTAGLWRRQAIVDAGGWEHDTLTEDMDLSYRSQLVNWKPFFLWDLVVPAELPDSINAFKSQQFRWAKGSIQTAMKLVPRVFKSDKPLLAKVQSVFHMTHYCIHPIMLWLSIMALPVMFLTPFRNTPITFSVLFALILLTTMAPSFLYGVSQCCLYKSGWQRPRYLPFLTFLGIGIALSNSRAVLQALRGKESEFVRTPKKGDKTLLSYTVEMPFLALIELALGLYCFVSLTFYFQEGEYIIGPFLALYAIGFSAVGILTLKHTFEEWRTATRLMKPKPA